MSDTRVPRAATWGLFVAWAVHDVEELVTTTRWLRTARPRLRRRFPWIPTAMWDRLSVSQRHTSTAIAVMGCLFAAASADGARTGGSGAFYQAVLLGFGMHAVPHVLASVATGGYVPGFITAPTVVAPFSVWAWRSLREAGVPAARIPSSAIAFFPVAVWGAHIGAAALLRLRDQCGIRRSSGSRTRVAPP